MIKKIILWILVVLWMGVIFYFSSFDGMESQDQSRGFLYHTLGNIIEFFDKDISEIEKEELIIKYDPIVRKIAHITIYLILGFLVFITLKEYNLDNRKLLLYTFLICILYACSDEIHQTFVSERSGKVTDILIDTIGISISVVPLYLWRKYDKRSLI